MPSLQGCCLQRGKPHECHSRPAVLSLKPSLQRLEPVYTCPTSCAGPLHLMPRQDGHDTPFKTPVGESMTKLPEWHLAAQYLLAAKLPVARCQQMLVAGSGFQSRFHQTPGCIALKMQLSLPLGQPAKLAAICGSAGTMQVWFTSKQNEGVQHKVDFAAL